MTNDECGHETGGLVPITRLSARITRMRITFLGHQGWYFEHEGRGLLLDPILESIGNGAARLPVWPRRRLDFTRFEPLDAVIISHEHADHFSLDTLNALPRRVRVLVPDLTSRAMTTAIAELGFAVHRFPALSGFILAGIRVTALPGLYNTLEPDTYALLLQDPSGASFLTAIDTVAHPDVCAWLAQHCPRRTLDNLTNNFVEPRAPLLRDGSSFTKSRAVVAANMMDFIQKFDPWRAVISGQGWSFEGAKRPLNHSFFSVDNHWLAKVATELAPHVGWFEGSPGLRFTLHGDQLQIDRSDLITVTECADREFHPHSVQVTEPFPPWSEEREISAERMSALRSFVIERYGQILGACAPRLMEKLYYLKFARLESIIPTLALVLRNGSARHTFEFDYGQLVFRETSVHAARHQYAVGLEMWASDLELLLGAQEEAFTVYESAVRPWSVAHEALDLASLQECFMWFTPRFRPQEFLEFYRGRIAELMAEGGAGSGDGSDAGDAGDAGDASDASDGGDKQLGGR